ncbi:MAG: hypothetical protein QOC80_548 [Frankiaceae bacterium]|nr:hypothetical protein [Frankiaceae bacterium]
MPTPDFLLIGAPKSGTTALHVALSRHPALCLSSTKEPKYFLTDGPPPTGGGPGDAETYREYVWQREQYEALWFHAEPGQLRGESTTLYLADHAAHRRIRAQVPHAKLVAVLRDPVDRAHSNWSHLRSAGLEPVGDFPRACMLGDSRAEQGWGPFWRYLQIGRYGEQLEHLYTQFDREQVLVLLYRDLREEPTKTLDRVCEFLGVETGLVDEVPAENVTAHVDDGIVNTALHRAVQGVEALGSVAPAPLRRAATSAAVKLLQREQQTRPTLALEERALLLPHFYEDIALLEKVLGRPFDHWRDLDNGSTRRSLDINGRFGTGFTSIDRPRT